jgi:hypothetical protein
MRSSWRTPSVQAALGSLIGVLAAGPDPAGAARPRRRLHHPGLGRHDLAHRAGRSRYGWPVHVIEDTGDDPALDQPAAFLGALRAALEPSTGSAGRGNSHSSGGASSIPDLDGCTGITAGIWTYVRPITLAVVYSQGGR